MNIESIPTAPLQMLSFGNPVVRMEVVKRLAKRQEQRQELSAHPQAGSKLVQALGEVQALLCVAVICAGVVCVLAGYILHSLDFLSAPFAFLIIPMLGMLSTAFVLGKREDNLWETLDLSEKVKPKP